MINEAIAFVADIIDLLICFLEIKISKRKKNK